MHRLWRVMALTLLLSPAAASATPPADEPAAPRPVRHVWLSLTARDAGVELVLNGVPLMEAQALTDAYWGGIVGPLLRRGENTLELRWRTRPEGSGSASVSRVDVDLFIAWIDLATQRRVGRAPLMTHTHYPELDEQRRPRAVTQKVQFDLGASYPATLPWLMNVERPFADADRKAVEALVLQVHAAYQKKDADAVVALWEVITRRAVTDDVEQMRRQQEEAIRKELADHAAPEDRLTPAELVIEKLPDLNLVVVGRTPEGKQPRSLVCSDVAGPTLALHEVFLSFTGESWEIVFVATRPVRRAPRAPAP